MSDVVDVSGVSLALTTHAIERYRLRVDRRALRAEVLEAAASGVVERVKPGWVSDHAADAPAWLVMPGGRVVFPLQPPHRKSAVGDVAEFVATTCLSKRRLSKPDVRWRREQAEEDAWAA